MKLITTFLTFSMVLATKLLLVAENFLSGKVINRQAILILTRTFSFPTSKLGYSALLTELFPLMPEDPK